jgi:hypothetical protein
LQANKQTNKQKKKTKNKQTNKQTNKKFAQSGHPDFQGPPPFMSTHSDSGTGLVWNNIPSLTNFILYVNDDVMTKYYISFKDVNT